MKKEYALVFGITKDMDFALANVLIGLKNYNKIKFDVFVYHDGIKEDIKNALNQIINCTFVDYNKTYKINNKSLKLYSNMCFSRFECFQLLDSYKKVIWSDVDILIQKDISGLLEYGDKTGLAMTYTDINFLTEANFNGLIEEYNMYLPLLNSGIIVFSDKLKNYKELKEWCYGAIEKFSSKLRYPDQGILNLLVQEFNIKVESIDINEFCCHPERKNSQRAAIVHSYGEEKFWNNSKLNNLFPKWQKNDLIWCEILKNTRHKMLKNDEVPIVSVVMSVYNRYIFLTEAVNSILNQTLQNFELIIVLEASEKQDEIKKLLEKYKDERIKIILNETKLGFANSLNKGIKLAKGKYIARMDDDDISLPKRLEKQVDFLENNKDYGMIGSAVKIFMSQNLECYPEVNPEKLKTYTLINNQFFHPTVMIKKSDIEKYKLYYSNNYKTEDAELWSRALKHIKATNLKEILLMYRMCNENETKTSVYEVLESDVKIIGKQLIENLNLKLTDNELYLLSGRVSKYNYIHNKDILKRKKIVSKKIIRVNNKVKYYNPIYLKEVLEYDDSVKSFIKKILKKLIAPLYNKFLYRLNMILEQNEKKILNYVDMKFREEKKDDKI